MFAPKSISSKAFPADDKVILDINLISSLQKTNYWIGNYFKDIGFPAHLVEQWGPFGDTWNDLDLDTFMADRGEYRARRFTEFLYTRSTQILSPLVHMPFFQSRQLNNLNGGVQRKFSPVTPFIAMHQITNYMIMYYCEIFFAMTNHDTWHINFHQVRVSAGTNMTGKPVPEGIHKDGVIFTTLFCVKRKNAEGAVNLIYDNSKKELTRVTLSRRGDCIILNDEALCHNVTDMTVDAGCEHAERDMLFIEFTKH